MACQVASPLDVSHECGLNHYDIGGVLAADTIFDDCDHGDADLHPREADQPSGGSQPADAHSKPLVQRAKARKTAPSSSLPRLPTPEVQSAHEADQDAGSDGEGDADDQFRDGDRVRINCNSVRGWYLMSTGQVVCRCDQCDGGKKGIAMTPTEFERHSGMAASKKWRRSLKMGDTDGELTLGRYLEQEGLGLKASKPGPQSSIVGAAQHAAAPSKTCTGGGGSGRTSPTCTNESADTEQGGSPAASSQNQHNTRHRPHPAPGPTRFQREAALVPEPPAKPQPKAAAKGVSIMLGALRLTGEPVPSLEESAMCLVDMKRRTCDHHRPVLESVMAYAQPCVQHQEWASDEENADHWEADEDYHGGGPGGCTRAGRATRPSVRLRDTLDPLRAMKPDLFPHCHAHPQQGCHGGGGHVQWHGQGGHHGAAASERMRRTSSTSSGGAFAAREGADGGDSPPAPGSAGAKRKRSSEDGAAHDAGSDGAGDEVAGPAGGGRAASRTGSTPEPCTVHAAAAAGAASDGEDDPVVTRCKRMAGGERLAVTICINGVNYTGLVGQVQPGSSEAVEVPVRLQAPPVPCMPEPRPAAAQPAPQPLLQMQA